MWVCPSLADCRGRKVSEFPAGHPEESALSVSSRLYFLDFCFKIKFILMSPCLLTGGIRWRR